MLTLAQRNLHLHTFSIVAYDPVEGAFGVGVASKFLAVGAVVGWARAGVGAVATQALAKIGYGPDGLRFMADGLSAAETLARLLEADPAREHRQVGLVDREGGSAAHTGTSCFDFAGHRTGQGYSLQGNILAGVGVLDAMEQAYQTASGTLADRLLAVLHAADAAGGDRRGKQSAALTVVKPGGGYGGDTDRYLDLRVDDDPNPLAKLSELRDLHRLFFDRPRPEDLLPITADLARELQTIMQKQGYYQLSIDGDWGDKSKFAFWAMVGNENLEERWHIEQNANQIDAVALNYLRQRYGA